MPQGKHSKLQTKLLTAINKVVEERQIAFTRIVMYLLAVIVPDIVVFAWERIPWMTMEMPTYSGLLQIGRSRFSPRPEPDQSYREYPALSQTR